MARKSNHKNKTSRTNRKADHRGLQPHISLSSRELRDAVERHQRGDLDAAAQAYQKILQREPRHAEALHLLGVIDHQSGRHELAIERIEQALQWNPDALLFRKNLASACRAAHRLEQARRACLDVLAVEPDEPVMHMLLGRIAEDESNWSLAVQQYRQALALRLSEQDRLESLVHLGDCLSRTGDHDQSETCFRAHTPGTPPALNCPSQSGTRIPGPKPPRRSVRILPQNPEIDPGCASAWNNLGVIHQTRAEFEKARECLERALELSPALPDVHNNLANILEALGEIAPCRTFFETAIALRPDYPEAYHSLGQLHLREQNYPTGWEFYRWRYRKRDHDHRHYNFPAWREESCEKQSLLVFSEQGIGDVIMFATCLPDLLTHARNVTVEVDPRMVGLFARSFPKVRVIPRPAIDVPERMHPPGIDLQISLADLPERYRRSPLDFPRQASLLQADSALQQKWRQRFQQLGTGLKVGISWFGGKNLELQTRRSLPLADWEPILKTPGVHFVNLQYGPAAQERLDIERRFGIPIHDWADSDPLQDLEDFSAKLSALDLVISIDNATVHFSGGLGVPCWTLLAAVPDWRWGLQSEITGWYESLRLFRQQRQGDWTPVVQRLATELPRLAEQARKPRVDFVPLPPKDGITSPAPRDAISRSIAQGNTPNSQAHPTKLRPRCAVITPVGPGHLELYRQAESSIRAACVRGAGPFREVIPFRLEDLEGVAGRSRARNFGVQQAARQGIEWVFFLDADDVMVPEALLNVEPYLEHYDAIWGQIYSFQDGNNQAERRDGQLQQTDRFEDILANDPFLTLQMGHFVRTEVALAHPFNELMDAGEDFDYYLRVWERHRCIKLDKPLFANRRGCHSSGPRSATGRDWTIAVNQMLHDYRLKRPTVRPKANPDADTPALSPPVSTRMKLAVYGMMRSGTTLLGDKLTVPGCGVVLLEPNMHLGVCPDHLRLQLEKFGITISEREWREGAAKGFQAFFNQRILPELNRLDYWGVKMVNFTRWQEFLEQYPAEHLILCVRDMRDVILSALDLAPKLDASVDENWIERRALETAQALVEMSRRPHFLMRYEDFCNEPAAIDRLAEQVGLPSVGQQRLGLEAVPHRLYEERKHGGQVSNRSVQRFQHEPQGPARALAERVWKQSAEYCLRFGYPVFGQETASPVKPNQNATVDSPARGEHPLETFWKQDQLANIIPHNEQLGAFPEGWDVRPFLWDWLRNDACRRVLEVGCGYGRLCQAFPADLYLGVDINPSAVEQAARTNPAYEFQTIGFEDPYPRADAILLYTVLLHIDDLSVGPMLRRLCAATDTLLIAEILGRQRWRRSGNPPVFNRDLQDYIALLQEQGFRLARAEEKPYRHYPDTCISFLKFIRQR
ncbi:MAG: tetratricopeptide repeat protein [Planctomycetaceae bacterium]